MTLFGIGSCGYNSLPWGQTKVGWTPNPIWLISSKMAMWRKRHLGSPMTLKAEISSVVQSCPTLCNPMDCSMPCLPDITIPGVYSNSCSLSWWYHPTISSSVVPFSFHLQSFPASESFPMSWFFASGGQRIEISPSASVLSMSIQDWFPLGWTGLISLQSKGLSRSFLIPQSKSISSSVLNFLYESPTLTYF